VLRFLGSPELLVVVGIGVVLIVLLWTAASAKPLGHFPYRWATWQAIESVLLAFLSGYLVVALASKSAFGSMLFAFAGLLSLFSALGLWRRRRAGAVYLVLSEICFLLMGLVTDIYHKSPGSNASAANNAVVLCFLIIDVSYFKKRWSALGPGFAVFMTRAGTEPAVPEVGATT
jgi:hypothetical protein